MAYQAACHCGNITGVLESAIRPDKMELRQCECTFCRKHGAITATDPKGTFKIKVAHEKDLSTYRFGLRTADFIVCSMCGVYVAALLNAEGKHFATVNVNTFKNVEEFTGTPKRVNYEKESAMEKVSRRQEKWTPATLDIAK